MNANIERARLLIEQRRYDMALESLHLAIGENPENPDAHVLTALALTELKRLPEALREAKTAIGLAPEADFCHYVLALVYNRMNQDKKAEAAIQQAILLDPHDADYHGLLSAIYHDRAEWKKALATAEVGLQIDPEHIQCTNLRAMAMVKLGQKEQAGQTIDAALTLDPLNPITHANQGWTWLQRNEPEKALIHFQEALRLSPNLEWAREGVVEALKARHFIYRMMLKYFFWMSKFGGRAQWGLIIGFMLFGRLLGPFKVVYMLFVMMTWSAGTLFNLLLRVDRVGRLALSEDQLRGSNLVGLALLTGLVSFLTGLFLDITPLLVGGIGFAALIVPFSGVFQCAPGKYRIFLAVYAGALTTFLILAISLALSGFSDQAYQFGLLFLFGWAGYTWIGNIAVSNSR